jgi:hypothetical protein
MPEYLRLCELTYGIVRENPAANFLSSRTHRLAGIARNRNALRHQLCPWDKEQTEKEHAVPSHWSKHYSEPQRR